MIEITKNFSTPGGRISTTYYAISIINYIYLQQSMQFLHLKFSVISIISFEEIIAKKFLSIELSKNRVESCRFLLKAVVTRMNNYNFLRNFTTDRSQRGVRKTTTVYEKVLGLEHICRLL